MKKLFVYIVLMGWLFALLDWKSVQLTRLKHPEWKDWMHNHEKIYQVITVPLEYVTCAPAIALKPIFYDVFMSVESSKEEQDWITHAPRPGWNGFYHLLDRRYSWTFVPWWSWFLYWFPISLVWWLLAKRYFK